MHVALAGLRAETLDHLRFAHGRKRRDGEHLRFAAGEHAGTMHARQDAGFAPDRTNLGQAAAIRANALFQNLGAHDLLVQVIQRVIDFIQAALETLGIQLVRLLLHLLLACAALVTVKRLKRPCAAVEEVRANGSLHVFARLGDRENALFLADFSDNLLLESNQLLDLLVTGENRAEHVRFADLLRARLDHQHGFIRTGDRQAQLGNRALLLIRIDNDFAIDQTDGNAADRARPRNIADRNRGGSADHRGDIRRHVLLDGKHRRHNLHVVAHALIEQRAQRAVDQTGGQRRLFGGTAFALDETAGDFAHGIHLLFKVNAQREKVLTFARRVARRRIDHDHRIAQSNDHRSVSLTAVLAKFHDQRAARQFCGIRLDHRVESPFKIPACQHFFFRREPSPPDIQNRLQRSVSFHKERKRPPLGATKTVSQTTVIWDKALFVNEAEELLAQTQLRNQRTIALDVDALEVLKHIAALTDHQQQTTVGVVILRVGLEVVVQVVDARGQQSDLHLGGAGVALVTGIFLDDCFLRRLIHDKNPPNTLLCQSPPA